MWYEYPAASFSHSFQAESFFLCLQVSLTKGTQRLELAGIQRLVSTYYSAPSHLVVLVVP
jgi:hypothetical protein